MSSAPLVRAHLRHVLLGGARTGPARGPRVSAALLVLLLGACLVGAAARTSARQEVVGPAVLLPAALVLAVSMTVVVLDQTGPRGVRGPMLVLPVSRRSSSRLQRVPGLVVVGALTLVATPAATVVLVRAGLGPPGAVAVLVACVVIGCGTGLLCSVAATWCLAVRGRRILPPALGAPVAMALWLGWVAASVSVVAGDGGAGVRVVEVAAGWPRVLDVVLGVVPATHLVLDVSVWMLAVVVLSGAPRPDPGRDQVWWQRRFHRTPLLVLGVVRMLRARPTQAHLLMGACLLLTLGAAHLRRPELGAAGAATAVAALLCAVCAAGARGLDGAVPLEIRWCVAPARHGLVVVLATTTCATPAVVLGLTATGPHTVGAVVALLALCLSSACLGLAVGAVLAAPAGDPAAELLTVAVLVAVALGAEALTPGDDPLHLAALLGAAATGAFLVAVAAHHQLDRRRRCGLLETSRKETT